MFDRRIWRNTTLKAMHQTENEKNWYNSKKYINHASDWKWIRKHLYKYIYITYNIEKKFK